MTEPFVKTEYGVSYSSLGNRRARRGSVSQNITHTAVGFMSSDGAPLLPPRPSQPLSSLFSTVCFLPPPPPPPPPITPLHLVTTQWCCSFPVCAASKTTTPPFLTTIGSTVHRHPLRLPRLASHHHLCHLSGIRQGLVLHHS